MTDTDDRLIDAVARAIGEAAVGDEPKWELLQTNSGRLLLIDGDSNAGAELRLLARAAIDAYRAYEQNKEPG